MIKGNKILKILLSRILLFESEMTAVPKKQSAIPEKHAENLI